METHRRNVLSNGLIFAFALLFAIGMVGSGRADQPSFTTIDGPGALSPRLRRHQYS